MIYFVISTTFKLYLWISETYLLIFQRRQPYKITKENGRFFTIPEDMEINYIIVLEGE